MITFFLQMRRTLRVLWSIFKVEEKIVELQQAKQELAETVTGSADGAILSMKPEELLVSLLFYCSVGHFFMQM